MFAQIRKAQQDEDGGFTLIELLVVMIIIGILAAVAIPVFLNQRAKAQDSAAKADASTIGKELATYYVDNTGAPPAVTAPSGRWQYGTAPNVVDLGKVSPGVTKINQTGTGASDWCFAVANTAGSQKYFKYSAAGGLEPTTSTGC